MIKQDIEKELRNGYTAAYFESNVDDEELVSSIEPVSTTCRKNLKMSKGGLGLSPAYYIAQGVAAATLKSAQRGLSWSEALKLGEKYVEGMASKDLTQFQKDIDKIK